MTKHSPILSPCRNCKKMVCRSHATDCHDVRDDSLSAYVCNDAVLSTAHVASSLVDNGRAGTLNRIEEIIEFCAGSNYTKVGIAYCYGIKDLAMELCETLEAAGLTTIPVSCTSGAVLERQIDPSKNGDAVSCNPAGQALVLNRKEPELVVDMGLCLGHDVIFHETLNVPVTVLLVKDRTVAHYTASLFTSFSDANRRFIETLDKQFAMKPPEWLNDRLQHDSNNLTVIDLRKEADFTMSRIPGSVSIPLGQLPARSGELHRSRITVCVCNGGVQSAYAVMFLFSRGFRDIHNLSGGFSRWTREGYPVAGGE